MYSAVMVLMMTNADNLLIVSMTVTVNERMNAFIFNLKLGRSEK